MTSHVTSRDEEAQNGFDCENQDEKGDKPLLSKEAVSVRAAQFFYVMFFFDYVMFVYTVLHNLYKISIFTECKCTKFKAANNKKINRIDYKFYERFRNQMIV